MNLFAVQPSTGWNELSRLGGWLLVLGMIAGVLVCGMGASSNAKNTMNVFAGRHESRRTIVRCEAEGGGGGGGGGSSRRA